MFDYEEIIKAWNIIQDACNKAGECNKCPLGNSDGDCIIQGNTPNELETIDIKEPQVIRIFE